MARLQTKDYHKKHDAILTSATQVFATTGFDRASMKQVADACETSKATLYHYFPSKNAILYAILERHLRELRHHVLSLQQQERSNIEFLYHIVEEILLQYQGNDDVHLLQIHALGQLDVADQTILRNIMKGLVAFVAEKIEIINPLRFDAEYDLRATTMSLFGMLNWYHTWSRGRGADARKRYAKKCCDIFLYGILKS